MTWWHDDISDQQRVNAIASRNATKVRRKHSRDIDWNSAIQRFQQMIEDEETMSNIGGRGRYRTADRWCVKPELYH